jgi:hypothetical protein
MKTIDLRKLRTYHLAQHMPAIIVAFAIVVLFAADGISQWRNIAHSAMSPAVPTPALPYYVMSTIVPTAQPPVPTAAPPTPDQALRQEVEQLRARVAELEARPSPEPPPPPPPQPEPVVIIQQAPAAAPTQPQPTPEPEADKSFAQSLIGIDPNAKACTGANGVVSPLCGGLTNQQAQQALDQR